MFKMNYKKIIERLEYQIGMDGINEIPSLPTTTAFLDGINFFNDELREELEFYIYEVPQMARATVKHKGFQYDVKNRDEFIEFLEKKFN